MDSKVESALNQFHVFGNLLLVKLMSRLGTFVAPIQSRIRKLSIESLAQSNRSSKKDELVRRSTMQLIVLCMKNGLYDDVQYANLLDMHLDYCQDILSMIAEVNKKPFTDKETKPQGLAVESLSYVCSVYERRFA